MPQPISGHLVEIRWGVCHGRDRADKILRFLTDDKAKFG
ncbi:hypothetical protein D082_30470 [Synechocystis sp. PCC 6714]|nr:hypothetical protein D082_30470 [Synechocystis sp. PCC 6714]